MPRIELTKKLLLQKRADMIIELHEEGWTDIDIGTIFNIDRTWVYQIRKTMEKEAAKAKRKKK